ncbi:ribosomal P protein AGP2beta-1 [Angomonas deanei]|uniref:Uncharacterized protein n=1 Tax=Angomonas deanei TaxID=59799 RepID=A0A7G2C4M5_9TRYP|nr:ribosomal P protein AGP2beta-1 [Angomonas deanei]CAD2213683.1 hypothetical protein, conserved [Angomonas deanei]|eukprot:EPY32163.1 ribosomal P protein AGP2beta-1 [Angomonas deanei]
MALQSHKDSFRLKELSLGDMVGLTDDCTQLCRGRTERIVENRSRAPRGWEKVFYNVAAERRDEEFATCLEKCQHVQRSCPESTKLKEAEIAFEEHPPTKKSGGWFSFGSKKDTTSNATLPASHVNSAYAAFSLMQMSRCEHALEDFSAELFTIAHKPSKVSFQGKDPATGEVKDSGDIAPPVTGKGATPSADPPSEAHRKVLEGGKAGQTAASALDDAIMQRWSTARKGKMALEEQGYLRSEEEAKAMKQKDYHPSQQQGQSGTTPKW